MRDIIETLKSVGQKLDFEGKLLVLTGVLLTCARLGRSISYGEVADIMRVYLGPGSQFFAGSHELARLLGARQREDDRKGTAFLSSLVVGQDSGHPGPGYFTQAMELGAPLKADATDDEKLNFWRTQRDRCFSMFSG